MPTPPDSLPDDASALKALLVAAQAENERLIAIIKELQRYRFGPRSEKIDPGQLALMLEDVEQAIAASAAQAESQTEDQPAKTLVQRKRQVNRGALPKHLPRKGSSSISPTRAAPAATAFASKSARMSRNGST
jgi:transposase